METVSSNTVITGSNNVVAKLLADLPGGKELDMSDASATEYDATQGWIPDGTPIILDGGAYKPLLAADKANATTAAKVIGVLFQPINSAEPHASICIRGVVTEAKMPYTINATIRGAVPGISFV